MSRKPLGALATVIAGQAQAQAPDISTEAVTVTTPAISLYPF